MRFLVRAHAPQRCELVHATYSGKVGSIYAHGLRISPATKRATAYVERGKFSDAREEAYRRSEETIEESRRIQRPDVPTRTHAVFLSPADGYVFLDEPSLAYSVSERHEKGIFDSAENRYDEYGNVIPDFGFGKDVLLLVDADKIPCKCGVGDGDRSDEVFRAYLNEIEPPRGFRIADAEPPDAARAFWRTAEPFDCKTYDPSRSWLTEEQVKAEQDAGGSNFLEVGDRYHEEPEVWCPCVVPPDAIVAKYDKLNRPPG